MICIITQPGYAVAHINLEYLLTQVLIYGCARMKITTGAVDAAYSCECDMTLQSDGWKSGVEVNQWPSKNIYR